MADNEGAEITAFPKAPAKASPAAKAVRDEKIDGWMKEGEQTCIRFLEHALSQMKDGTFRASGAVLILTDAESSYVINDAGIFLGPHMIGLLEITKARFVARHAISEQDA